jgi:hypothetical protein
MAAPPDAEKGERSTRKPGRQVRVNDPARGIRWGPPGAGGPRRWSRPWSDWSSEPVSPAFGGAVHAGTVPPRRVHGAEATDRERPSFDRSGLMSGLQKQALSRRRAAVAYHDHNRRERIASVAS